MVDILEFKIRHIKYCCYHGVFNKAPLVNQVACPWILEGSTEKNFENVQRGPSYLDLCTQKIIIYLFHGTISVPTALTVTDFPNSYPYIYF